MARRIMLSTRETVLEETSTAFPLTAWTLARPLRVRLEVRKTSAGEGGTVAGALFEPEADAALPDLEALCGEGSELAM